MESLNGFFPVGALDSPIERLEPLPIAEPALPSEPLPIINPIGRFEHEAEIRRLEMIEPAPGIEGITAEIQALAQRRIPVVMEEIALPKSPRQEFDDSWGFDSRGFISSRPERFEPGEGLFGRPYHQSRQVLTRVPRLAMPSKRWRQRFFDPYHCRECGARREGNRCTACGTAVCEECMLTLEDGRCTNSRCMRFEPEDCRSCSHWPCECETPV